MGSTLQSHRVTWGYKQRGKTNSPSSYFLTKSQTKNLSNHPITSLSTSHHNTICNSVGCLLGVPKPTKDSGNQLVIPKPRTTGLTGLAGLLPGSPSSLGEGPGLPPQSLQSAVLIRMRIPPTHSMKSKLRRVFIMRTPQPTNGSLPEPSQNPMPSAKRSCLAPSALDSTTSIPYCQAPGR